MVPAESANEWAWHWGFNTCIDFCVWALEVDGLHVPPFDRHAEGNRVLRRVGLTAEAWRAWMESIAGAQGAQAGYRPSTRLPDSPIPRAFHPPSMWIGEPAIAHALRDLWARYEAVLDGRKQCENLYVSGANAGGAVAWHSLLAVSRDITPYRESLPTLRVYFVAYPQLVAYPVPPTSTVLSLDQAVPDGAALHDRILRVARQLAYQGA